MGCCGQLSAAWGVGSQAPGPIPNRLNRRKAGIDAQSASPRGWGPAKLAFAGRGEELPP